MSSPSHKPNRSLQSSERTTKTSAIKNAIESQLYDFEKSLARRQLWAKQLADEQETSIREAAKKALAAAKEVDEVLKGANCSAATKEEPKGFSSEMINWELKHPSHSTSRQFPRVRSEPRSVSPSRDKEVDGRGRDRAKHRQVRSIERRVDRSSKYPRSRSRSQDREVGRSSNYRHRRSQREEIGIESSHYRRSGSREKSLFRSWSRRHSHEKNYSPRSEAGEHFREKRYSPKREHLKYHSIRSSFKEREKIRDILTDDKEINTSLQCGSSSYQVSK